MSPPSFNGDTIFGNMNYQGEDFIKDIIPRMNLVRRRDVAFAFYNVLQMSKEGKINIEQEEFYGKLTIKKV